MKTHAKMPRFSAVGALLVAMLMLPQLAHAKLKVVATVGDLAAVAEEVGGGDVAVTLLADPNEDPHFVDAKPSFVKEMAAADVLVFNGASLEVGWLPTLIKGSRNAKIQSGAEGYFDASTAIKRMGVPTGKVSRAAGDVHPEGNPHYTLDPRQMARVAIALGAKLGKIDPENADAYKSRARDFAKKALTSAKTWSDKFATLPKQCRNVAVYHEAWSYVLDWLGLHSAIAIEPKPGVPPNPRHVARVFKTIQANKVHAILQKSFYPSTISKTIAQKTGAKLISVQGQTHAHKSYLKRVDKLAGDLYSALKKGCK